MIIVRDMDGEVRAFHNICRHRGNKLVWTDFPQEESSGNARQFVCKYHGWKYELDGACAFVQQEGEFFDFDKADYGLVPVHCDVWAGFIFVNLADEPSQTLTEFLGPMVTAIDGYPFDQMTERFSYRATSGATGSSSSTRSRSSTTHPFCTRSRRRRSSRCPRRRPASKVCTTRSTVRTAWSRPTAGGAGRCPKRC